MHLHLIKEAIKDIISVLLGNPQGGLIEGFPLMFHMPCADMEHPIPPRFFFAAIPIIPVAVGMLKGLDVMIERWKLRNTSAKGD